MDNNYTHILVVMDRSGSMETCASEMETGLRNLVKKQKLEPGKCTMTFVKFDNYIETPFSFKDVKLVEEQELKLEPRGGTALYDALKASIDQTGAELAKIPESLRPGQVIVLVITDGEENSSRVATSQEVKALISEQTTKYSWEFNYLGANQDGFAVGNALGMHNSYKYDTAKSEKVFDLYSGKLSMARSMKSQNLNVDMAFDACEVKEIN